MTMAQVLLSQQYSGKMPYFSVQQTHLALLLLSQALCAQMLAEAGPGSEPEGKLLGVEWTWSWVSQEVGFSWMALAQGRAWLQLICSCLFQIPKVLAWPWSSFGQLLLRFLLQLLFNNLPNTVTDQTPQSHLILGTGNFIDTHPQLLFFYFLEKYSEHEEKPRPCCSSSGSGYRFNRHCAKSSDWR